MPSLILPPFHVISDEQAGDPCVVASEWEVNGRSLEDGTFPGWDYGTDLVARREVRLGTKLIREQTRLAEGSVIRVTVTWSTGSGFECQELAFAKDVPLGGPAKPIEIEFPIPGSSLAFAVVLSTSVVLARRGPRTGHGAAMQPGSVLWQDDYSIAIEGSGPRLPVLVVDLEPEGTAWAVRTAHDWLNSHPSVGVNVLINKRRDEIVKAFLAEPPSDRDLAIRCTLFFDVGRQLIERALLDADFADDAPFAPQTCGLAIRNRVRAIFDRGIDDVRALQESEPEEFNKILQAGHALFAVTP
jgi:hypothetical protein